MKCNKTCEVYSRVVGYHRPVTNWNIGKTEEWKDRVEYSEEVSKENGRFKAKEIRRDM